jgi:hypothetical protein
MEFLRPAPVHPPADPAGQACDLDRLLAVLAAEPSADGRDDHADGGFAYPERLAEPGGDGERDVGAGLGGQPPAVPFCDARSCLQRDMGEVGRRVGGRHLRRGCGQRGLCVPGS